MEHSRYRVLDSWRGIAALAVVAFHFRTKVGLDGQPFFDGMSLFVDFFFVLSGFVIFAAYGQRLGDGFNSARFLWLRLARIYPLHLFTLALYLFVNVSFNYPESQIWFPAPRESLDTIIGNLLLIQSWGFFSSLTWNKPSWSISAEFFAYLVFAAAVPIAGRKMWLICLVTAFASLLFLVMFNGGKYLDTTWRFGIVRCLYGFSVGILAFQMHSQSPHFGRYLKRHRTLATIVEAAIIALTVYFISAAHVGPLTLAAPLLFALVVMVFAQEAGAFSAILSWRAFTFLGLISYSIYMMHMPILSWWLTVVRGVLYKLGGAALFESVSNFVRANLFMDGQNYTGLIMMLFVVSAAGAVTYCLIEKPFRDLSRKSALFTRSAVEA